jgi:hypothetical protein
MMSIGRFKNTALPTCAMYTQFGAVWKTGKVRNVILCYPLALMGDGNGPWYKNLERCDINIFKENMS